MEPFAIVEGCCKMAADGAFCTLLVVNLGVLPCEVTVLHDRHWTCLHRPEQVKQRQGGVKTGQGEG